MQVTGSLPLLQGIIHSRRKSMTQLLQMAGRDWDQGLEEDPLGLARLGKPR